MLDWSCVQLEGSHTPAKNGGAAIGYQGRKKARTTNALFLADNQGQPLAVATPQTGQPPRCFSHRGPVRERCVLLEAAGIPVEGLFLNADGAFDPKQMRQACAARHVEANSTRNRRAADWQTDDDTLFDDVLSRRRVVVEQANARLDGFKTLLVRYETRVENWLAFHWLAFGVLFLREMPAKSTF